MNRLTKYLPNINSMIPYRLKDEELSTKLDSIHKLGELEDIEEELGIELITLFKALKEGIWVKYDSDFGMTNKPKIKITKDTATEICYRNKKGIFKKMKPLRKITEKRGH